MPNDKENPETSEDQTFVEGLDFYFDEGMMVLTKRYLQNRGYCCENICRHCPYGNAPDDRSE